ncbi:MAG: hypothetical protein ACR2PZ_20470 [Pseudomonadales bacterium]
MSSRSQVLIVSDASRTEHNLVREIHLLLGSERISLKGLFIEDEEVLRATGLPIVKEVSHAGEVRDLTQDRLRQEFLQVASSLKHTLSNIANEMGYSSSFEVVKGSHSVELARAAADVDFVVFARAHLPGYLRPRRGPDLVPLLSQAKSLLVVNEPWLSGRSVVVVYEGMASAEALRLAGGYARSAALDLIVVTPEGAQNPEEEAYATAQQVEMECTESALATLCQARDARLLVFSHSDSLQLANMLPELVDRVPCSILRLA